MQIKKPVKKNIQLEEIFKILGTKTNFRIVYLLFKVGCLPLDDIARVFKISQACASNHLTKLIDHGILIEKFKNKNYFYSLNAKNKKLLKLKNIFLIPHNDL